MRQDRRLGRKRTLVVLDAPGLKPTPLVRVRVSRALGQGVRFVCARPGFPFGDRAGFARGFRFLTFANPHLADACP